MKKHFLLILIALSTLACSKDDETKTIYPTDLQGGWDCIDLKSSLLTNNEALDKEINNKLGAYTPDLVLSFTANTCTFYIVREGALLGEKTLPYDLNNTQFVYNAKSIEESDDDKIRADIQLKGNKLYMTFNCPDFKNYVYVLGKNYPFHKNFLDPAIGGSVTITFNRQIYD